MIPLSHAGRDVTGGGLELQFFTGPLGVSVSLLKIPHLMEMRFCHF